MKITCEHCGAIIDTTKDKKCTNCGAPYSKNKEYSKVKDVNNKNVDFDLREREANIRTKEIANEFIEKQMKTTKKIAIIPVIIFCIAFIIILTIIINMFKSTNQLNINNNPFSNFSENENENKNKTIKEVSFNENAETNDYDIKCDGTREYKYDWYESEDDRPNGIIYYGFHFIFKNKTNTTIPFYNNVDLTYTDDKGNENITAKKHFANSNESSETIEMITQANKTYSGYIFFELPDYVKNVKIKYDNIVITLDNFKELK